MRKEDLGATVKAPVTGAAAALLSVVAAAVVTALPAAHVDTAHISTPSHPQARALAMCSMCTTGRSREEYSTPSYHALILSCA